jgi:ElaB/YqjD/DUF883 family membrane-anchored ribosome-binding protein
MGKSAEELKAEIADNRAQLSDTMDAIGDRVSPGRMIERKKNRVAQTARSLKERVMGTVDDVGHSVSGAAHDTTQGVSNMPDAIRTRSQGNPMVAGGIAFGVGFLAAVAFPASRTERDATSTMMSKAEPVTGELTKAAHEIADHLKEPAQNAVAEVKTAANQAATSVTDTAKDSAQHTSDEATKVAKDLRSS